MTRASWGTVAEGRKVQTVTRWGGWFPGMLTPALAEHLDTKQTLKA